MASRDGSVAALCRNYAQTKIQGPEGPRKPPVKPRTHFLQAPAGPPSTVVGKSEPITNTNILANIPFQYKQKPEQGRPRTQYQLLPKKQCLDGEEESESKLRRWTVGTKDPRRSVKTILLVGETGTGKSTMINVMLNHILGISRDDPVWFELVDEASKTQSESQTTAVTVYEVLGYASPRFPHGLCVVDTPGYGDTRGTDHDAQVVRSLYDLFRCEDGIPQIDAVGLVLKESTNRLSDRQQYIFNSVVSLFGKDIEKNIVALITHSNGVSVDNALSALQDADIRIAKNKHGEPFYFPFDNCQNKVSKGRKEEKRAMQHAWETSHKGMYDLLAFLCAAEPQKLGMTVEVLDKRIQIEACFNSLQERIRIIELKQVALNHTKDAINSYVDEAESLPKFTITVEEPYKVKVRLERGTALFCTACEENCHYPGCTLALNPSWCKVMKDGFCTSCANKCPPSKHVRGRWKYVTETRSVVKTVEDVSRKYAITQKVNQKMLLIVALKRDIDQAKREKDAFTEKAFQCVVQLDEMSLAKNCIGTYIHLDFLIEKLNALGHDDKVSKLKEIQSKMSKEVKEGISYAHRK